MKRWRGFYVEVRTATRTKSRKAVCGGYILMAIGEPDSDAWLPVIHLGRLDHVRLDAVERIAPAKTNSSGRVSAYWAPKRFAPWLLRDERKLAPFVRSKMGLYSASSMKRLGPVAKKLGRTVHGVIARIALLRLIVRRRKAR